VELNEHIGKQAYTYIFSLKSTHVVIDVDTPTLVEQKEAWNGNQKSWILDVVLCNLG